MFGNTSDDEKENKKYENEFTTCANVDVRAWRGIKQARHYMTQQDKYADAEIKAATPLERASIRTRLSEIDLHLTNIRADASALYREMIRVILIIGGTMPPMSSEDQKALAVVKG
jgi:hypothetical protein